MHFRFVFPPEPGKRFAACSVEWAQVKKGQLLLFDVMGDDTIQLLSWKAPWDYYSSIHFLLACIWLMQKLLRVHWPNKSGEVLSSSWSMSCVRARTLVTQVAVSMSHKKSGFRIPKKDHTAHWAEREIYVSQMKSVRYVRSCVLYRLSQARTL